MISQRQLSAIDRSGLPETFVTNERQKSNLLLEANFLQQLGEFEAAADKFALAAPLEEALAEQLLALGKIDKAFIHQFSAVSCWVQAGDLHRALVLGQQLQQSAHLSTAQQAHVTNYLNLLRKRMVRWISEWQPEPLTAS